MTASDLSPQRKGTEAELVEHVLHRWQMKAIEEGFVSAERGELIDHDEIKAYWESKLGNQMDQARGS